MRFFEEAVTLGADAMIVHHGLGLPAGVHFDQVFGNRLRFLFEHNLTLFGYHYLLDSHPEIGNNVLIIKAMGGRLTQPYPFPPGDWGWQGVFEDGAERDQILKRCTNLFSQQGIQYPFGSKLVYKVVALSGGGAPGTREIDWLIKNEIDLYITGEAREWNRELFREAGINFVAGGHYHTERLGIQALGEVIQRELDVTVKFLDLPNPV
jgi:putative NIF3 family GTP cyclohydrolase 1 type 2